MVIREQINQNANSFSISSTRNTLLELTRTVQSFDYIIEKTRAQHNLIICTVLSFHPDNAKNSKRSDTVSITQVIPLNYMNKQYLISSVLNLYLCSRN